MFHACVERFDGMDEKFLGGELNMASFFGTKQGLALAQCWFALTGLYHQDSSHSLHSDQSMEKRTL